MLSAEKLRELRDWLRAQAAQGGADIVDDDGGEDADTHPDEAAKETAP